MSVAPVLDTTIVDTTSGRIAGSIRHDLCIFRGVPFARARRFGMPEPFAPTQGVRDATANGAMCPQAPTALEALMGASPGSQGEDCLNLNIWTPACDGARRPVMVWIHGGAFVIGSGCTGIYNGRHLAARGDVVIVTINYRLGVFGFLNLRDATDGRIGATGAEGIADQIAALTWVRDNIANFGGDPANVTIFGESAGAMSVASLMASPKARGLFHKAIPQSGGGHIGYARDKAARVAAAVLDLAGASAKDPGKLETMSWEDLLKIQVEILGDVRERGDTRKLGRMPLQPAIDGDFLPEKPIDALRKRAAANIPTLTGTTRDEWQLFTAMLPDMRALKPEKLEHMAVASFGEETARAMLGAYAEGTPFARFNALMTDRVFRIPMTRLLEAQSAAGAPSYAYRFDWSAPIGGGMLGACHAVELGFVFGTHAAPPADQFFGSGPKADRLSGEIMDAWIAFARTGNPATDATGDWPAYDTAKRTTALFGEEPPVVVHAPDETQRQVWEPLPDKALGT